MDIQSVKAPIVEKGISSNKNYMVAFCETSFHSVHSANIVETYFLLRSCETLFLLKLQVDFQGVKSLIEERGISSNKNYPEAFCETSFCSVHSTNRVEHYF